MKQTIDSIFKMFRKATPQEMVFAELEQSNKEFITSEKHRMYQEAMSSYLNKYMQFLEDLK